MVKELMITEVASISSAQITNFVDIFNDKDYKSLRTVAKYHGDVQTKQAMIAVIGNVFGVTTSQTAIDVEATNVSLLCDYIFETYPDLSLKDIQFFAKKLLRGEFIGKKIGDVVIKPFKYDVPTLCFMFQRFYSERLDVFEQMKQDESNEMKLAFKEIHPDITKMFEDQEKLAGYNGIYKSLQHYCEINELQESLFIDSYTKLYDNLIESGEISGDDKIDLMDYIRVKSAEFLVFQNSLQTTSNINKLTKFNEIIEHCSNYDIEKLVAMTKGFGLWMIPTRFYFAAKKILFDGGVLKYRYDISEQSVIVINEFVKKAIEDRTVSTIQILFVLSMIFNCSIHIGRFNKYNGLEVEQKTDSE